MNGTCSGTHIIYQCGYGLEAGVQTPSSCLPFTDLGSLISISRFLLFRKWIAQQGSRKAPEKKISRQECQQKYDYAEAGCPVDVTVHVRSCQASERRGNYREQNVSKESNEPPLSLDVPSCSLILFPNSFAMRAVSKRVCLMSRSCWPTNCSDQLTRLSRSRISLL